MFGNMTKYQNDTELIADENKEAGLGLFQIVLLSFTLISSIALVFSLVYFMLRKRALDELRHRLVPLYHFDPGECEDWEDELLEDSKKEILGSGRKREGDLRFYHYLKVYKYEDDEESKPNITQRVLQKFKEN